MVSVRNLINFCWGVGGQQLVHFIDKQPKNTAALSLSAYSLFFSATILNLSHKNSRSCKRGSLSQEHSHKQKCDEGQWHPVAWLLGCRHCSKCYLVVLVASLLLCVCVHMHPTFISFCAVCVCVWSEFSDYDNQNECIFFPCSNFSIHSLCNKHGSL